MTNTKGTRRRFGTIRKLPSGRFQARYTGPDLGTHKAPRTFESRDDAGAWLRSEEKLIEFSEWRAPAERARAAEAKGVTVAEYVSAWIDGRGLRTSSANMYRAIASKRVDLYLTGPLTDLTPAEVRAWSVQLGRDFPATKARNAQAYRLLGAAMKTAVEDGLLESSPCQTPKAGAKPKPRTERLAEPEEFSALVAALPEVYRAMALITAGCALRLGEVTELRRKDIERGDVMALNVRRGVAFVGNTPEVGRLKNGDSNRRVTVPPHLVPILDDHLERFSPPGAEGLIFPDRHGAQVHPNRFRQSFGYAAKRAGRPDLHPHSLRHLGAVQYAQAGATIRELMDRLGHSTPSTALIYQHTAAGRDAELAARMSQMANS